MIRISIAIPGAVWEDFLSPDASTMESELGLPTPTRRRVGARGRQWLYADVDQRVALDLAEYLADRGGMLLDQGVSDPYDPFEKSMRATYRARRSGRRSGSARANSGPASSPPTLEALSRFDNVRRSGLESRYNQPRRLHLCTARTPQ